LEGEGVVLRWEIICREVDRPQGDRVISLGWDMGWDRPKAGVRETRVAILRVSSVHCWYGSDIDVSTLDFTLVLTLVLTQCFSLWFLLMFDWSGRLTEMANKMAGNPRLVVLQIMLHLQGKEIFSIHQLLLQAQENAIAAEGDLRVLEVDLLEICTHLLQLELFWRSAANLGDVFWNADGAADYLNELFMQTVERYPVASEEALQEALALPDCSTDHLVLTLTIAFEGEEPNLETDLADRSALKQGLICVTNLQEQQRLRAIQVHFSPAAIGEVLTEDEILERYPELIPI
jgi:Protein of unknown function (DUF1517)